MARWIYCLQIVPGMTSLEISLCGNLQLSPWPKWGLYFFLLNAAHKHIIKRFGSRVLCAIALARHMTLFSTFLLPRSLQ